MDTSDGPGFIRRLPHYKVTFRKIFLKSAHITGCHEAAWLCQKSFQAVAVAWGPMVRSAGGVRTSPRAGDEDVGPD